jgi:hypothetical protein
MPLAVRLLCLALCLLSRSLFLRFCQRLPPSTIARPPPAALLRVVELSLHVLRAGCGRRSCTPTAAFLRRHPRRQYPPCPSASRLRTHQRRWLS